MRINSINNRPAVTFGYNKKLNDELKEVLNSEPSVSNISLLKLNDFCNETEDTVNFSEKISKKDEFELYDEDTETLISVLIDLKRTLALSINEIYPELNYAATEAEGYRKEAKGDDASWKTELAEYLEDIAAEDNEEDDDDEEKNPTENFPVKPESIVGFNSIEVWKN